MSKLSIRVYYEDTDSGGVVYYANYLKYIERGRSEYLRELNFDQEQLSRDHSALFVVRSLQANYLLPAFLDDLIEKIKLNKISTKVTLGGCFVEKINETILISREKSSKT